MTLNRLFTGLVLLCTLEVHAAVKPANFPVYSPGPKLTGFYPLYKANAHIRLFKSGQFMTPVQIYNTQGNLKESLQQLQKAPLHCSKNKKVETCYSIASHNGKFSLKMAAAESGSSQLKWVTAQNLPSEKVAVELSQQFNFKSGK